MSIVNDNLAFDITIYLGIIGTLIGGVSIGAIVIWEYIQRRKRNDNK